MKKLLLSSIHVYQKLISPVARVQYGALGCKYHPTCSEYSRMALIKHGVLVGLVKSLWRILKCNPISKGGIDYL